MRTICRRRFAQQKETMASVPVRLPKKALSCWNWVFTGERYG
jgi:hypothetical protein